MKFIEVKDKAQIQLVADMAKSIWREHFKGIISNGQIEYMLEKIQSFDAISKAINEDGYSYYIFCNENTPMGYMGIHAEDDKLFLSKLYLLKEFRGKGFARQAMDFLESYCKENDLSSVWLTCNKHNTGSLAVYDSLGFVKVKEAAADIGSGYVMDDFILEKNLD